MTRDELVERMARAHYEKYNEGVEDLEYAWRDPECHESHWLRMTESMRAALTELEKHAVVNPKKSL